MKNNRHFISRNYKHPYCGGVIAKTDIELTLERLGFTNIGLKRSFSGNNIVNAIRSCLSAFIGSINLKRGDILLLQYPMSHYYRFICRVAKWKKVKIITLIHDLRAFRNKSITADIENVHLSDSTVLLTHNYKMREWLHTYGCTVPMVDYEIMDYLHGESAPPKVKHRKTYSMYYVGNLSNVTNGFLYELAAIIPEVDIYLYGANPDMEKISALPNLHYMGFKADVEIMTTRRGDFGLSWYGNSIDKGVGKVGEYMEYNNPHKVSLYLRCNTPVVVWKNAGRAEFIEKEGVGVCVESLRDLRERFETIGEDHYIRMTGNVERINRRLKEGYYLEEALRNVMEFVN